MPYRHTVPQTLAVVDLGSNSFRLEIGRVEGDQIFRLDTWRETIRFGAGLDHRGHLTPKAQRDALGCLERFAERLRGLHPSAVRAVATNTFREAKNAHDFLPRAVAALGFPIDIIGGHEEARLIYLGVSHVLPASTAPRLVIDIGGGSTEFIIGRGFDPERLESLKVGCVGMTQRFFADGKLDARRLAAAKTHARAEIEAIAKDFDRAHWKESYASSGTALALAEILEGNGLSSGGITPEGLARLEKRMVQAGHIDRLDLPGLKPARTPVLAGGLAVMSAAMAELRVERINPVGGALRLGVLHDLLGRTVDRDARMVTIERFAERYHVDREHAQRVSALAKALYLRGALRPTPEAAQRVVWAALLHEIGFTVSHIGFHKHGAYILQHADMPGFSSGEQSRLALLVLGCRGNLAKIPGARRCRHTGAGGRRSARGDPPPRTPSNPAARHHARGPRQDPLRAARALAAAHPLTAHLLDKERSEWAAAGYPMQRAS